MSRIALRDEDCQVGAEAYCRSSNYRTEATDGDVEDLYEDLLDEFYNSPTCPVEDDVALNLKRDAGDERATFARSDDPKFTATMNVLYHVLIGASAAWLTTWNSRISRSGGN